MLSKSWKELNEEKAGFWNVHIEQWAESGLSQIEYCRQNDLRPNRFTYWKIKLRKKNLPLKLVQVPVPIRCCQTGLKFNIGRGLQVVISDGFNKETLEQVLAVLKVVP